MNNPVDMAVYDRGHAVLEGEVMGVDDAPDVADSHAIGALEPTLVSIDEAARALRSELRARYPASQFSVRRFTRFGKDLRITYVDGPSRDEVQRLADAYLGYRYESDIARGDGGDGGDYIPLPGRWVGNTFVRYDIERVSIDRDTSEGRASMPARIDTFMARAVEEEGDAATTNLYAAAAYLSVSKATVVKLINAGEIAAARGRGNSWNINVVSLRAYAAKAAHTEES